MKVSLSGQMLFVFSIVSGVVWLTGMSTGLSLGGLLHWFLVIGIVTFIIGLTSAERPSRTPGEPKAHEQRRSSGLLRR